MVEGVLRQSYGLRVLRYCHCRLGFFCEARPRLLLYAAAIHLLAQWNVAAMTWIRGPWWDEPDDKLDHKDNDKDEEKHLGDSGSGG